jgi:hypothetical protein
MSRWYGVTISSTLRRFYFRSNYTRFPGSTRFCDLVPEQLLEDSFSVSTNRPGDQHEEERNHLQDAQGILERTL